MVVTQHTIHIDLVDNEFKDFLWVPTESNVPDLTLLLHFLECRQGLIDNLLHGDELDIMAQGNVQMISAQAVKTHIHAFLDSAG